MKIQNKTSTTKSIGKFEENKVSIDQSNLDFVINILSTNLYSNPLGSFLRETVSNAVDSHKEAGKPDNEPVLIEIEGYDSNNHKVSPVYLRPEDVRNWSITVRDFGTGLSPERFEKIYKYIGSSSKRDSNDYIGGWGIGRFSALAVSDVVQITSYYNNVQYIYTMRKSGTSLSIDKIAEVPNTERENGLEVKVSFPDTKYNFTDIKINLFKQLALFKSVYIQDNIGNFNDRYIAKFDIPTEDNQESIQMIAFDDKENIISYLRGSGTIPPIGGKTRLTTAINVAIDRVCYKMPQVIKDKYPFLQEISFVNKEFRTVPSVNKSKFYINFSVGELDVTPNREALLESDKTLKAIEEKVKALRDKFEKAYKEKYSLVKDIDTLLEYRTNLSVEITDLNKDVEISNLKNKDLSVFKLSLSKADKFFKGSISQEDVRLELEEGDSFDISRDKLKTILSSISERLSIYAVAKCENGYKTFTAYNKPDSKELFKFSKEYYNNSKLVQVDENKSNISAAGLSSIKRRYFEKYYNGYGVVKLSVKPFDDFEYVVDQHYGDRDSEEEKKELKNKCKKIVDFVYDQVEDFEVVKMIRDLPKLSEIFPSNKEMEEALGYDPEKRNSSTPKKKEDHVRLGKLEESHITDTFPLVRNEHKQSVPLKTLRKKPMTVVYSNYTCKKIRAMAYVCSKEYKTMFVGIHSNDQKKVKDLKNFIHIDDYIQKVPKPLVNALTVFKMFTVLVEEGYLDSTDFRSMRCDENAFNKYLDRGGRDKLKNQLKDRCLEVVEKIKKGEAFKYKIDTLSYLVSVVVDGLKSLLYDIYTNFPNTSDPQAVDLLPSLLTSKENTNCFNVKDFNTLKSFISKSGYIKNDYLLRHAVFCGDIKEDILPMINRVYDREVVASFRRLLKYYKPHNCQTFIDFGYRYANIQDINVEEADIRNIRWENINFLRLISLISMVGDKINKCFDFLLQSSADNFKIHKKIRVNDRFYNFKEDTNTSNN